MIFRSIETVGSYAFPSKPVSVNFETLPLVVCVAGLTGSGKSSLLDLCMAGIYLEMPYRTGPLYRRFVNRGFIRLRWATAEKTYYSDIRIDPFAEKVEATLYEDPDDRAEGDRRPGIAGPLARDFLRETTRIAGPLEAALVAMYSVQSNPNHKHSTGSFLSLSKADRRELFSDLLDLGRYEKWATLAASYVTKTTAQLERVRGRIDELEKLTSELAGTKILLEEHRRHLREAEDELAKADRAQRLILESERAYKAAVAQQAESHAALATLISDIESYEAQATSLEKRIQANNDLLANRDAILEAVRVHSKAEGKVAALEPSVAELAEVKAKLKTIEDRLTAIKDQADEAAVLFRNEAKIREEAERLEGIETELVLLEPAIEIESDEYQRRYAEWLAVQALKPQAALLDQVPCGGEGEYASCPLISEAKAAREKLNLSTFYEPVDPRPKLKERRTALRNEKYGMQYAKRAPELELAKRDRQLLSNESSALLEQQKVLKARKAELVDHVSLRDENIRIRDSKLHLVKLKPHLDLADERLQERQAQLESVRQELEARYLKKATLEAVLATVPQGPSSIDVQAARAALTNAAGSVAAWNKKVGAYEEKLAAAVQARDEQDKLKPQVDQILDSLSLYTELAKALGPLGIPTLRVDQALPAIGMLATEMLQACYGEQVFTIKVKSQRESADGKKMIEDLRVDVLRNNEETEVSVLSGGESVLVSESISLAWALFGANNSGRRYHTLMRDESSSALDAQKAPAYIRLLRRAAELGDFNRVLFVSHQPACEKVADAVLKVENGTVTVEVV